MSNNLPKNLITSPTLPLDYYIKGNSRQIRRSMTDIEKEEIESRIKDAYNKGRKEGYEAGINEVEAYHLGYFKGYEDGKHDRL